MVAGRSSVHWSSACAAETPARAAAKGAICQEGPRFLSSCLARGVGQSCLAPLDGAVLPCGGSSVKKVLIVEDQEDILEVITITLELDHYDLHTAADGEAALKLAVKIRPDLVLSDVMMPRMDGLQLCKRIKSEASLKRTKLILLSARGHADDRRAGLAAGADAYLTKPYSPLQLLETVRQVLF